MVTEADNAIRESEEVLNGGISSPSIVNVQEMVRCNLSCIPDRFKRSEEDKSKDVDLSVLSPQIPVIDLALLSSENVEELKKLEWACKCWGFFMATNHGIPKEVLQRVKDAAAGFFELPFEEKIAYSLDSNEMQGYGRPFMVSEEEKLDWSDSLILSIYPSHFQKLKFWPTTPADFRDTVETYSTEVRKVAETLLGSLSLTMGMTKDALLRLHKDMAQALRVNYYPTCRNPDQVIGISPHSDATSISILLQDDDVTGLEIQHDGGWVPVNPIPNSLVVNIGDVIEMWSNGKYNSIEHRAMANENKARMSLATFFTPDTDVEIEPLDHILDPQGSNRIYKKVKYGDYLTRSLRKKIEGKTNLRFAKDND
ncbi:protein SRG1-like [Vitis riparia]|uniref:protein SRG1-like n=1 Tax=Vitis riparia TaxID=96939 RepID=UPI00155A4D0D|nr:protein SRG1-like [Vitis riparia]